MKKGTLLLLVPSLVAGGVALGLYHVSSNFNGLFTHDVCEAHTHAALLPFISVISIALGFIPALFYMAQVLYGAQPVISQEQAKELQEILSATPDSITIGQVFSFAGANCKLRVKAVKNTLSTDAYLSQFDYLLNFSL